MKKLFMYPVLAVLLVAAMLAVGLGQAVAAGTDTTDNPSVASTGYETITIPLLGTYTGVSAKNGVVKFRAHWPFRLIACHTSVRTTGAKAARLKARLVFDNGTTVFSNVSSSGQVVSESVGRNVTDETDIRVDLVGPGVGQTATNVTIDLAVKRR